MNHRFHRSLFPLILLLSPSACATRDVVVADAWSNSPTGKCFKSLSAYMSATFSHDYEDDENISISEASSPVKNRHYYWVRDNTPQINSTASLFAVDEHGRACGVLYVPLSSSIAFEIGPGGSLPATAMSLDTPPAGFPATRVTYKLRINGTYATKKCEHISSDGDAKPFNCKRAFLED